MSPKSLPSILSITTIIQAMVSFGALALAAIAPRVAQDIGVASALIGFQVALVYGGAMLTSLVGGTLVQRHGACRTSQIAVFCNGAGLLAISLGGLARLPPGPL